MTTLAQRRALAISARIMDAEVQAQRMLGADWIDAYTRAWAFGDEAYNLVLDAHDKPFVHEVARVLSVGTGRLA